VPARETIDVVDPVSMIVAALASGAASGLTKVAGTAISDAYKALKRLIADKYKLSTDSIERKPESPKQQDALHEELADARAGDDSDVVKAAKLLLDAIKADDPGAAKTVGVDLERIWAGDIDIEGIKASDGATGVKGRDITAQSIKIKDVEATGQGTDRP
jgi:hypothetical protein